MSASEWNQPIIDEFRANGGKVGGRFEGRPLLLLHHRGAKSGIERLNPLAYRGIGDAVAVFASNSGLPTNPDWYYNVVANPDVEVEVGTERYPAIARVATGQERDAIYDEQKAAFPNFADYEVSAVPRVIPVVVLERR